jgi:hypothetical protein
VAAIEQPKFATIADGLRAQVIEVTGVIPPHLNAASHEGRMASCPCRPLVESMQRVKTHQVRVLGIRADCRDQHDYRPSMTGVYRGMDLLLSTCVFCGAVEIRDVSYDILPGLQAGRGGPRRRSDVLGWYSGIRANARTYG